MAIKNPNLCFGCPNFSTIGCYATACPRDNLAVVTTTTATNTGDWNIREERTCHNKHGHCDKCGSLLILKGNYCFNCGAKVEQ